MPRSDYKIWPGSSGFARSSEATTSGKNMKYCVYILKSLVNSDFYVGSTENVGNRLKLHNAGKVKSTKVYKPWKLLEYQEFDSRSEAVKRELFLKNHQQKEILKRKYNLT